MTRGWRPAALVATMVALCVAVLQAPAVAAPVANPDRAQDRATVAALQRLATKTHTPADLELIKSQPELAAKVADPDNVKIEVDAPPELEAALANPSAVAPLGECCYWIKVTITQRTVAGFDLFKWVHYIEFCLEPMSHITRWVQRYDYLEYADGTIQPRNLVVDSATPAGGFSITSMKQRHLEQCVVQYGCYANWYPWSQIGVRADGLWGYNWGVG